LIIQFPAFAQYGTTEGLILFTGEVIDEDSETPLSDIHLLNRNNGNVTVSDPSGFFSMYISKIHVIRFTSVGYEPFYFSIPGGFKGDVYFHKIALTKRTTPLENVTIYGEPDKTESILSVKEIPNPLEGVSYGTLQGEAHEVEPSLMNIASLMWEWWSREGKEKRKLKEILRKDAIRDKVDKRFESELIWELTGLYGEELERFKRYCNLPQGFVITANEYDFLITIKTCYYNYKNQ
jgi:hypothetical protein